MEYVSFMWAVANRAGEGCVTLHSLLASGLFDKSVAHYLRRGSKAFKNLTKQRVQFRRGIRLGFYGKSLPGC